MAETVFNVNAAKSYIKRFTNAVVFGKADQSFNSTGQKSLFFCKIPLNTSHIISLEIKEDSQESTKVGSLIFAISAGKTSYADSCVTVLGASTPGLISQAKILVSSNFLDNSDTDHLLVGAKIGNVGSVKMTYQILSSNRAVVTAISESREVAINFKSYDLSKGYLLNRALFEETDILNAFRQWSSTYQYSANDPVFYGAHLYYANPNLLPLAGEDPVHYPSKWIELATAEIPDTDISKGAETPQLFYKESLVITNDTAAGLRKAHRDVGYQYPSANSKVYHFDEDLLDQDQQNALAIDVDENPEIPPMFVGKGMVGVGISSDPAIDFKPLKEVPAFYYGNFGIKKTLNFGSGNNAVAFHFKYPDVSELENQRILIITCPSGEKIHLVANYSEIDYNSDEVMPYWDLEDNPAYSEGESLTSSLAVISYYGADIVRTEVFQGYPLVSDSWAHLCVKVDEYSVTIFYRGQQVTIPRLSSGFGSFEFSINRDHQAFAIDELIWDTTASIPFSRYIELTSASLPWAEHEKDDNWFSLHVQDLTKFDTNIFDSPLFEAKVRQIIASANS